MLIARGIQAFGALSLIAGLALAAFGLTQIEASDARRERVACEAMARLEALTTPRVAPRRCPPATTHDALMLFVVAASGTLSGLGLLGFAALLLDVRRIRERLDQPAAVPQLSLATQREPTRSQGAPADYDSPRGPRLRRLDSPRDVALRVLVNHARGAVFSPEQVADVADAVEGEALRGGREITRYEAEKEALSTLGAAYRASAQGEGVPHA